MWAPLALLVSAAVCLQAQSPPAEAARKWRQMNERAILDEFAGLLAIPNIASNIPDMRRNAAHIRAMMEKRGVRTELLEVPDSPPAIYGELLTPGAKQTLIFYVHYDGQPVEAQHWKDAGPFEPIFRDGLLEDGARLVTLPASGPVPPEWRIYSRSASDDKAPIIGLLTALDALKQARIPLRSNIKFFLDGEEEAGSPHLAALLEKYKAKLQSDAWIFCDGPVHQTRRQAITFGVRGSTGFQLTVYGPRRELHSGHYGNWAPNPALMLAHLIASMRDEDGRVRVAGFYDDVEPLSESEKRAIAAMPEVETKLKRELLLARTEGAGKRLDELIALPALNIQGIASAGVGSQSRNVVPASATASIGIRLVKGMNHRRTLDKVIEHIRRQGYHVVETEPDEATRLRYPKVCRISRRDGYNAVRAPMDSAIAQKVIEAVRAARGDLVLIPTAGGSLPIAPIEETLRKPVIMVPIANHDNNQHGHNENIRIQNLWDGIETMAALLTIR